MNTVGVSNMKRANGFLGLGWFNKPERAAYLFILPALTILLLFTVLPLLATVAFGFLRLDVFLKSVSGAGLSHFHRLLDDSRYWNSVRNTLYFAVVEVPLQILLALLLAVYASRSSWFSRFIRSAFFLPSICSFTAIGIIWSFLLDPQTGMYPYWLSELGLPRLEFLRDPQLAMPSVILMTVWRNFGYSMIILVAGIQSISASYYEAAELDGANRRRQFFHITIPMIIPALSFCVITSMIGALQIFDPIFVTTQGGPMNRTETMVAYIYNVGFSMPPYDLGYASAISVSLFILILVITLLLNSYFLKKETSDLN